VSLHFKRQRRADCAYPVHVHEESGVYITRTLVPGLFAMKGETYFGIFLKDGLRVANEFFFDDAKTKAEAVIAELPKKDGDDK